MEWFVPLHPSGSVIRAALLGVSFDMPALRKVSQFLGHKADLGAPVALIWLKENLKLGLLVVK